MIVMAIALLTGAVVAAKANVPEISAVYQQDDKAKFRAEINEKIEKNKARIAELRAEAKKDKDKMDAKTEKKIDDLEARNNKLRDKLNSYDGKSDWAKFKEEVNHDSDQLGTAIADVFKDNKK
jgi:hypothetical protein